MKYALVLVMAFAFTGCSFFKSSGCDMAKSASSLVSAQVATTLDCKNLDAVKADIEAKLVDLKICEAKPAARSAISIPDLLCAPMIDGLASTLLNQIPANWECSGGVITAELKTQLVDACKKAL